MDAISRRHRNLTLARRLAHRAAGWSVIAATSASKAASRAGRGTRRRHRAHWAAAVRASARCAPSANSDSESPTATERPRPRRRLSAIRHNVPPHSSTKPCRNDPAIPQRPSSGVQPLGSGAAVSPFASANLTLCETMCYLSGLIDQQFQSPSLRKVQFNFGKLRKERSGKLCCDQLSLSGERPEH